MPDLLQRLKEIPGYEGHRIIGKGGLGTAVLAKNTSLDRLEVLKVLNPEWQAVPGMRERFQREMRLVSRLKHPSIVTCYAILPVPDMLVFAMEHVQGQDLQQMVERSGRIDWKSVTVFSIQVLQGLIHAWKQGIVHRDIKPANLMLDSTAGQSRAKILDFGLAKAASERESGGLTTADSMLGTLEYLAPEQCRDPRSADHRADLYSLGCTIFHLVAGRLPYQGGPQAQLLMHAGDPVPRLSEIAADCPPGLSAVVERMMAKTPDARYPTPEKALAAMSDLVRKHRITSASFAAPVQDGRAGDAPFQPVAKTRIEQSADRRVHSTPPVTVLREREPRPFTGSPGRRRPKAQVSIVRGVVLWGLAIGLGFLCYGLGTRLAARLSGDDPVSQATGTKASGSTPPDPPASVEGSAAPGDSGAVDPLMPVPESPAVAEGVPAPTPAKAPSPENQSATGAASVLPADSSPGQPAAPATNLDLMTGASEGSLNEPGKGLPPDAGGSAPTRLPADWQVLLAPGVEATRSVWEASGAGDADWTGERVKLNPRSDREATLATALPPGNFHLALVMRNPDGFWKQIELSSPDIAVNTGGIPPGFGTSREKQFVAAGSLGRRGIAWNRGEELVMAESLPISPVDDYLLEVIVYRDIIVTRINGKVAGRLSGQQRTGPCRVILRTPLHSPWEIAGLFARGLPDQLDLDEALSQPAALPREP